MNSCSSNSHLHFSKILEMKLHASLHRVRHQPRALLSAEQAIEIYKLRRCWKFDSNGRFISGATIIAKNFNISPKTVRDIWNRRTWSYETRHLWDDDEERSHRPVISHLLTQRQCVDLDLNTSFQRFQHSMPSFEGAWSPSRSPNPLVDASSGNGTPEVQLAFLQSLNMTDSDTNHSRWRPGIRSDQRDQGLRIKHSHIIEAQVTFADEESHTFWDLECEPLTAPDPFLLDWPLW